MLDCFDALPGKGIYVTRPGDWAEVVRRFCDLVYPLDARMPCASSASPGPTARPPPSSIWSRSSRPRASGSSPSAPWASPATGSRWWRPASPPRPRSSCAGCCTPSRGAATWWSWRSSSHALDQGRVHGIPLQNAGWTNFTQDHLDYHRDEASYFAAKARILDLIEDGGRLYCTSPEVAERLRALGRAAGARSRSWRPPP